MKSIQVKAGELWRLCVKYRDKWCVICGKVLEKPEMLEAHHIYFRSSGNWKVQYDIDFGCALDHKHHQEAPDAPHVDNQAFIDKLLPRLSHERQAKIAEFLMNPKEVCTEKADYHQICCDLALKLKELQEWFEIDKYSTDEVYKGRTE